MVHALEEIRRLLKPDGRLIDIHPFPEAPRIEVHQGDRILFAEPNPGHGQDQEEQADDALARIVQRRLFVIERSGEFDFLIYGSSIAELQGFLAETGAYEADRPPDEAVAAREEELFARVEEVMLAAGEGADVAYHERGRIMRLKSVRY